MPRIVFILSALKAKKEASQSDSDDIMATSVNAGWTKMNNYYKHTENIVVYAAAVFLNLLYK
jgi:hypothetical protein